MAAAKSLEGVLVKRAHQQETYTEFQVREFVKCADPVTGPAYFMDNYFNIQHPTKGKMLYHPFDYQKRLIDIYHNYRFSISLMPRQTGKCLSSGTNITVMNNKTGKQYELPIGLYYRFMQAKRDSCPLPDISDYETK